MPVNLSLDSADWSCIILANARPSADTATDMTVTVYRSSGTHQFPDDILSINFCFTIQTLLIFIARDLPYGLQLEIPKPYGIVRLQQQQSTNYKKA